MPGMRRGRLTVRSGAGGMKARGVGGGSTGGAICSGNSDGLGGIGRMVTSSIMGKTAAATAALAAASIASGVGGEGAVGAVGVASGRARVSMRSAGRCGGSARN